MQFGERFAVLRGDHADHAGEHDEAARLYRDWLAHDPENPVVLHQLAAIDTAAAQQPVRASDAYVETIFDSFAPQFDAKLNGLGYRAPQLVGSGQAGRQGGGDEAEERQQGAAHGPGIMRGARAAGKRARPNHRR